MDGLDVVFKDVSGPAAGPAAVSVCCASADSSTAAPLALHARSG